MRVENGQVVSYSMMDVIASVNKPHHPLCKMARRMISEKPADKKWVDKFWKNWAKNT